MNVVQKFMDGVLVEWTINGVSQLTGVVHVTDQWPIWSKALKQLATPEDKGIGDVIARIIGDENSAKFKAWHIATFGKHCNCNGRQARWNRQFPLNT